MLIELSDLPTPDWGLLLPQLIVFGLALVLLFGDAFVARSKHFAWLTGLSLVGYGAALVSLWWQDGRNESTFYGLFRADGLTVFLSLIILVAAILTVMISASYVDRLEGRMPIGEFYVLLAFSVLGALLVAVGLGFKMAAVPFHFWTPDAYDGAATPVTAFMSVVPKAAAFAATIRLLVQGLGPMRDDWLNLIAALA